MNTVIEEVTPWLEIIENAIFSDLECPNDFEKTFCDGNELYDVFFSSDAFIVYYMLSSGNIVRKDFSMEKLSDWLDKDE